MSKEIPHGLIKNTEKYIISIQYIMNNVKIIKPIFLLRDVPRTLGVRLFARQKSLKFEDYLLIFGLIIMTLS